MTDLSDRLDQIDKKLDKLSDAIIQLARIEERISNQSESITQLKEKNETLEKRIRNLEHQGSSRGVVFSGIERFFWLIISAIIGIAVYLIKK